MPKRGDKAIRSVLKNREASVEIAEIFFLPRKTSLIPFDGNRVGPACFLWARTSRATRRNEPTSPDGCKGWTEEMLMYKPGSFRRFKKLRPKRPRPAVGWWARILVEWWSVILQARVGGVVGGVNRVQHLDFKLVADASRNFENFPPPTIYPQSGEE